MFHRSSYEEQWRGTAYNQPDLSHQDARGHGKGGSPWPWHAGAQRQQVEPEGLQYPLSQREGPDGLHYLAQHGREPEGTYTEQLRCRRAHDGHYAPRHVGGRTWHSDGWQQGSSSWAQESWSVPPADTTARLLRELLENAPSAGRAAAASVDTNASPWQGNDAEGEDELQTPSASSGRPRSLALTLLPWAAGDTRVSGAGAWLQGGDDVSEQQENYQSAIIELGGDPNSALGKAGGDMPQRGYPTLRANACKGARKEARKGSRETAFAIPEQLEGSTVTTTKAGGVAGMGTSSQDQQRLEPDGTQEPEPKDPIENLSKQRQSEQMLYPVIGVITERQKTWSQNIAWMSNVGPFKSSYIGGLNIDVPCVKACTVRVKPFGIEVKMVEGVFVVSKVAENSAAEQQRVPVGSVLSRGGRCAGVPVESASDAEALLAHDVPFTLFFARYRTLDLDNCSFCLQL